jgi:pimeloyl-ACP methyl ester carboxylesterase
LINILFVFLLYTQNIFTAPKEVEYFLNLKNTFNVQKTQKELFKLGFKKVFFMTSDKVELCGLFLDKSKKETVKGTIIYCGGFYPGLKEDMSSFYSLLIDKPYNILLFDARGHSESKGDVFSYTGIKNYTVNEYLDIIGAVEFINRYNTENNIRRDIILHGNCAGAFNAIKAVDNIIKNNDFEKSCIKGIIFDSGWFCLDEIAKPTIYAHFERHLKDGWFWWAAKPISYITYQIYNFLFLNHHKTLPNIYESIKNIKCPIFFVHCTDDNYVPIKPVQETAPKCNCTYYWWINHNSHGSYHIHNYDCYQEKLLEFLEVIYQNPV